jgi:hypothetical protein
MYPRENGLITPRNIPEPEEPLLRRAKKAAVSGIRRFGFVVAIVLWFVVFGYIFLIHMHVLPESWQVEVVPAHELPALALVIALMFILSEELKEYKEELTEFKDEAHTFAKSVDERIDVLNADVKNLVTILAPQLALLQCVERLQQALHKIPPSETLYIRHLGLDMETAWLHVRDKLLEEERKDWRIKIQYHLLMVTGDYSEVSVSPDLRLEMEQMCHRAKVNLENIKTYLARVGKAFDHVDLEIRTYATLPVLHGLYANKPTPLRYISLCGWRSRHQRSEYHWGEGHYYEIHGTPRPGTSTRDMMDLYDGYFDHLWNMGKQVYPVRRH